LIAVPIAIVVGGAMGLLNGVLHVKLKTPSFMTTLGVGFAGIGIATTVLGGFTARRAGPGRLDRFPRTISGVLPGLLSLPHRGWDEGRA
jgi:ribose/xylose/arabinose/galactoside ABC-type transport system permease subunit